MFLVYFVGLMWCVFTISGFVLFMVLGWIGDLWFFVVAVILWFERVLWVIWVVVFVGFPGLVVLGGCCSV